jgi:hypothetical protein
MRRIDALSDPFQGGFAVTPADADFANNAQARGFYVGGAGNVSFVTVDGTTLTLSNVPAGTFVPWSVKQIRATGTTATLIVAGT